ncbi:MAG: efflux RND transporter periplasmic adaptor subunit [Terrimicrobiaceae bacterium]
MLLSRRTKRVILGFSAILIFVVFVVVAAGRYMSGVSERQRFEQERAELKPPEPLAVEIVEKPLVRVKRYAADLVPWKQAAVPSEVAGRVIETAVEAGQVVSKGDTLMKVEDRRAKITLELTQARHEEAMRLLGEAERLQKSSVVSQTQYESVLSSAKVTKAQLDEAKDAWERHTVKAPFDGVVNQRLVDQGDAVNINQAVVELVDVERLRVKFMVAGNDLSAFSPGREVEVRLLSGGRQNVAAKVDYVSRSADPATKMFQVEAVVDNAGGGMAGGLQGVVEVEVESFPNGPVAPAAAVRFSGRDAEVLVDAGAAEPVSKRITVGPEIDGLYPVLEGLKAGDRIFIR